MAKLSHRSKAYKADVKNLKKARKALTHAKKRVRKHK